MRKQSEIVRIETPDCIILLDVSRFPPDLMPNSAKPAYTVNEQDKIVYRKVR